MTKMECIKVDIWKCPNCGHTIYIKPHDGECPACRGDVIYTDRTEERNESNH